MNDWEDSLGSEDFDPIDEPRMTLRQMVVRGVALLLLVSSLASFYGMLRDIEDIPVVIGVLAGVGLVARMLRKLRDEENPYQSGPDTGDELD